MDKIKNILGSYRQISLEPVFLLFSINIGLISIASRSIYIDKTCKVNLNETEAICAHIQEFNETQKEVQKYVSDIQAYNGALQVIIFCKKSHSIVMRHYQSALGIIFILFAGPLTDSYGRKPLIISALIGFFLLDIIFLVNSIWFFELKVNI